MRFMMSGIRWWMSTDSIDQGGAQRLNRAQWTCAFGKFVKINYYRRITGSSLTYAEIITQLPGNNRFMWKLLFTTFSSSRKTNRSENFSEFFKKKTLFKWGNKMWLLVLIVTDCNLAGLPQLNVPYDCAIRPTGCSINSRVDLSCNLL